MPAVSKRYPKTPLHERFCRRVKERREELGWTQIRAAEEMRVPQSRWSAIENGVTMPLLNVVERVAAALRCEPEALLEPQRSRSRASA